MMLRYVCVAFMPALGRSFVSRPFTKASSYRAFRAAASDSSKDLEHQMTQSWADLQRKGRELEENPTSTDALRLAEEVLEMALAYTHTKELVEESEVHSAHEALEKAIDTEKALELAEREARQDIAEAERLLQENLPSSSSSSISQGSDNTNKQRQSVVLDISHRVENYVESRLAEAQLAEEQARRAEMVAKEHLEELQKREADLKATLDELKLFKLREERGL